MEKASSPQNPLTSTISNGSSNAIAEPNPYNYTSGRWLRRDDLERSARKIDFDFENLCRKVVSLSPGASSVVSYEKKEGGFNRVILLTLDNGKRVIARLPFRVAGPPRLTTNSEVATIRYRRFCIVLADRKRTNC